MEKIEADVVIIGGSFSGLSAALLLANALRKVVVVDNKNPINERATHMHNVLGSEAKKPLKFLANARKQLKSYSNLIFINDTALTVQKDGENFQIKSDNHQILTRKLLLATGVQYQLPKIKNIEKFWVKNIFHCPYCAAPDVRDQPLAVFSVNDEAYEQALLIHKWTKDFVLLTNGECSCTSKQLSHLNQLGIQIKNEKVSHFSGRAGKEIKIHFENGEQITRKGIFMHLNFTQQAEDLIKQCGCLYTEHQLLQVDDNCMTSVNGIYAAGDMISKLHTVTKALASGTEAAIAIDHVITSAVE